jgi:hypothetical protein
VDRGERFPATEELQRKLARSAAERRRASMQGPPPDYSLPAVLRAQGPPEGLWLDSVYVPRAQPVWPQEGRDLMNGRRMTLIGDSQVISSPLSSDLLGCPSITL